ncbi:NAD(P)H-binding protein [Streptomyces sp. SID11385]|uniref:NAD(P)H-binding protein n=1 Tax=Streptomyces sp. SID11385 TaxID=2706031 RepID=UPI0013C6036F|nr:NAD(P)H-binding protein [Streptomyces sp. SID11385]
MTAASGQYGRLVVEGLLARGAPVAAVVRRPERAAGLAALGAEVRYGDYDDAASLRTAFAGGERLLLVSSPELDTGRRVAQHVRAVDAARAAGVGLLAYTSFLGAGTRAEGVTAAHHATERHIEASGLPHLLLRHPYYSDAFLHAGLREAVAAGVLEDGTGGRGLNTASRADLAEAAVRLLTGQPVRAAYDLTGAPWTYRELAETLTRVSGGTVTYTGRTAPVPGPAGWLDAQVRAGALEDWTDDLAALLGRPPASLEEAVREVLGK